MKKYHILSFPAKNGWLCVTIKATVLILFAAVIFILPQSLTAQRTYRLSKAPFYKTVKKHEIKPEAKIVHLPLVQDESLETEFFYQGRGNILLPVIEVMNHYLDSLAWSTVITPDNQPDRGRPWLFVGSSEAEEAPPESEMQRLDTDKFPPMIMFIRKPSKEWFSMLKQKMDERQAEYAILTWIGFNEYPKANKGLFKKKVVLGTGYEPEIRFLSAEDKPVEVLQVSAMLIDKNGEVLRAGAEAFLYEDTPFWAQVVGMEKAIDDNTIHTSITAERRDDLPGKPLAWKVALYNLMEQVTQRPKKY